MMRRIGRLTAAEILKLSSQPFLYVALALLLLFIPGFELLTAIVSGQKETAWKSLNSVQLFAYGFKPGLKIATYVLLIFSSMMFAGEFDRGTIKNLLTRPITRLEFFIAKCVTITGLAVLLFGFAFYVSAVVALVRGDVGPIWHDSQYYIHRDGDVILGFARKAILMSFLAFLTAGFMGILVSNLTESSGYSVAIALVAFLVSDLATGMLIDRAKEKLFMYYPSYAIDKLTQFGEGDTTRWAPNIDEQMLYLTVPSLYIIVFIPLAFSIFRSRNITA
jgi:ABC-2 type transport system permease protein